MAYPTILAAIKAVFDGITDIGQVYDQIRYTNDPHELLSRYIDRIGGYNQIRVWLITRVSGGDIVGPQEDAFGTGIWVSTQSRLSKYDMVIDGFMSFEDNETEAEFLALVDSVRDTLKNNLTFSNTAFTRGPLVYEIDHVELDEIICHHINMKFWVTEYDGVNPV